MSAAKKGRTFSPEHLAAISAARSASKMPQGRPKGRTDRRPLDSVIGSDTASSFAGDMFDAVGKEV